MAKGAAKEATLGALHAKLAQVFTKVLERYEDNLDALAEASENGGLEEDLMEAALTVTEPSPAMLSAIAKFLKDNEIGLDSEEVEQLSSTQRRLRDKEERRKAAGLSIVNIPRVADSA